MYLVQGFLPDVHGAFPPLGSVGQAISAHQKQVSVGPFHMHVNAILRMGSKYPNAQSPLMTTT